MAQKCAGGIGTAKYVRPPRPQAESCSTCAAAGCLTSHRRRSSPRSLDMDSMRLRCGVADGVGGQGGGGLRGEAEAEVWMQQGAGQEEVEAGASQEGAEAGAGQAEAEAGA
eukprot:102276-Chlamydomonas_euryale.AAC.1